MKKIKIELSYEELNKISNGLFSLRQKYIKLNHLTFIDNTSTVNKSIEIEVAKIDLLSNKIENYIEEFDSRS